MRGTQHDKSARRAADKSARRLADKNGRDRNQTQNAKFKILFRPRRNDEGSER